MATNMLLNAEQVSSLIDAHVQSDLGVTFTKGYTAAIPKTRGSMVEYIGW